MRRSLVIANWKMNGSVDFIDQWTNVFTTFSPVNTELAVCPPFVYIRYLQQKFLTSALDINVGAQDCSVHESGAFTGEVSAGMLADVKCPWVIVGHSERRQYFHETDEIINKKMRKAIEHKLLPILCCGESLEQRESGVTLEFIKKQIVNAFKYIPPEKVINCIIAYEPIWAIGTGRVATAEQAQEVCSAIRTNIRDIYGAVVAERIRILYGGSVNAGNANHIFSMPDIDGGLVGGASLKAVPASSLNLQR